MDEILSVTDSAGTPRYHHHDGLGSVIALTDTTGAVVERYRYDVFGKPEFYDGTNTLIAGATQSPLGNRFLYTGREQLTDLGADSLGLMDYRNRVYSPNLGRFMQPDPIGFKGEDSNIYRYVRNQPISQLDPYGLMAAQPVAVLMWSCTLAWGPSNSATGDWATFECLYNCTLIKKFGQEATPLGTVMQMIGTERRRLPSDITVWYCNKYGWTIPAGVATAPCPSPVFVKETINRADQSVYADTYGFDSWE